MTLEEIQTLIQSGEGETVEFKKTTGERVEAMHDLCAFLNSKGGHIIFGVEPNGKIVGQQASDKTLEEIAQEIQRIEPAVSPTVEQVPWSGSQSLIVITTTTGTSRPYRYKGQAFKRVANSSQKMSSDEFNEILIERVHGDQRWETGIASDWKLKDIDASEVTRTVEEAIRRGRMAEPGTRNTADLLRGFGLLKDGQLLKAAIVLFGKADRLEMEMAQCLLRVAKFKGVDKTEFLDNKQLHGNAFELLRKAERFWIENLPVAGRIVAGVFDRVDEPLYPPEALREAMANAICHRDYSLGGGSVSVAIYDDRLEITSSGRLHFGLTPEKLFQPHDSLPWNPTIAKVFFRRGIIESWGRGTQKIAELTEKASLPRPDIDEVGGSVVVRFKPSFYVPPSEVKRNLTDRQQNILRLISQEKSGLSRKQLVEALQEDDLSIRDELQRLRDLNLLRLVGHGRGASWLLAKR